jgi:cobalt/nickel transport system permease protein
MTFAGSALTDIRVLEELAANDTLVHRRHPVVNLLVTLGYITAVTSYGKYELAAMLPLVLYPLFIFAIGEIPLRPILARMLPALPFIIGVGIFNPIYDHQVIATIGGVAVSAGWLSFLSIVLRGCLTITAALLFISVEGIVGFSAALRALRVPPILVMQLTLTFRYIHVLGEEAARMSLAYQLRAPGSRGVVYRDWGPLAGQWLLRTLKRADRIFQAMLCRGYSGVWPQAKEEPFRWADAGYLAAWAAFFVMARLVSIPQAIGALVVGVGG